MQQCQTLFGATYAQAIWAGVGALHPVCQRASYCFIVCTVYQIMVLSQWMF